MLIPHSLTVSCCFIQVIRIIDLLSFELELEVEREENLTQLVQSLEEMIADKEYEIENTKRIAKEMDDVRSQLDDGMIAENLDQLIELKYTIPVIEQELVDDLTECLYDLKGLLEDARDRAARTQLAMEGLSEPPETRALEPFDWTDIEEVELVLQLAADNVASEKERIRELSQRIDEALVNRAVVLGEDVPPGLAKTAQRSAARSIKNALSLPDVDFELDSEWLLALKDRNILREALSLPSVNIDLDVEDILDLKERDEKELLSRLAKSVGSATVDGSKAAFYGLKAVVDTMAGESSANGRNQRRQGGSKFMKDIGETESAQVAGQELKKTGADLLDSVETVAALGAKLFDKATKRNGNKDSSRNGSSGRWNDPY
jgi:hypothetical protein